MDTPLNTGPMTAPMVAFQVCFHPLLAPGQPLAFPCDETGHVDLDALSDDAREDYLFARALVGRDYAAPRVCAPREFAMM